MKNVVLAHAVPSGIGGLGHQAAHALDALSSLTSGVHAYGPGRADQHEGASARTSPAAPFVAPWRRRYTWLRYATGRFQHAVDRGFGQWLANALADRPFDRGYFFTQVALESLALARRRGALTILDNPNGHIRDYRDQLCREWPRWTGWPYLGHPSEAMVRRVEEEYRLADRIRVSSQWSKRSLVLNGVDENKIFVVPQPIDLNRFSPARPVAPVGPLNIVFAGSISLGKGFQYLLQAMSRLGGHHFRLRMVGATGDPWCSRLLDRMKVGLDVTHASGDPLPAYRASELFVLPSLHDGFGLVVAEAMACGLPVITTDACGASEYVNGEAGWVLPRGDEDAVAGALEMALSHRGRLAEMGRQARKAVEPLNNDAVRGQFHQRVREEWMSAAAVSRTPGNVWHVVSSEYPPDIGGVSDYTRHVAEALASAGDEVHVWCPASQPRDVSGPVHVHPALGRCRPTDLRNVADSLDRFPAPRRLLVQWVPHGYGFRSMNLWFCLWLASRARSGDRIELMVHEPFVDLKAGPLRHMFQAFVHRLMAIVLMRCAAKVWVAIPAWEPKLRPYALGRRIRIDWLPIPGCAVSGTLQSETPIRGQYAEPSQPVVGHFGAYGAEVSSLLEDRLVGLMNASERPVLLLIGAQSEPFRAGLVARHPAWAHRVHATGFVPSTALGGYLEACDVLVQPYPDGITSRRTSAMTCLSLGRPVVTTSGHLTEPFWADSGAVAMVDVADAAGFVTEFRRLLGRPDERARIGQRARQLCGARFNVSKVVSALRAA